MVLDSYRGKVDPILSLIAKPFLRFNPNTLTVMSLVFAIFGSVLFFLDFLLISSCVIFFSALFDALDGKVARTKGVASRKGDFLDHLLDRYSDAILILGIGMSRYCDARLALLALVGVYMASYVGTQAQAVGVGRIYAGLLGRAERMIALTLLPILQHFLVGEIFSLTVTEILMIYFGIAGVITSIYRANIAWKKLERS